MSEHDQLWVCQVCGTHHVIPDLARQCERKHETSTTPTPGASVPTP